MENMYRIFDFNVYNEKDEMDDNETLVFKIQIFGLNKIGETASIIVEGFKPFFYVSVNDTWKNTTKDRFLQFIKDKIGNNYSNSISECILIKRKKLYGFDGGKLHKFIKFEFKNMSAFNKVKNLWYSDYNESQNNSHKLLPNGVRFENTFIKIYESNIPPILRFFHIQDVSPSGWIHLPKLRTTTILNTKTTCKYEYLINYKNINLYNV